MPARGARLSEQARFLRHVRKTDTCWLWTARLSPGGYGQYKLSEPLADGTAAYHTKRAHRVAYEMWVGPIPADRELDHLCRVRRCVNPEHLEVVTGQENKARGTGFIPENIRKVVCPRGHPYSGLNNQGRRICHTCARDWMRQYRAGAA